MSSDQTKVYCLLSSVKRDTLRKWYHEGLEDTKLIPQGTRVKTNANESIEITKLVVSKPTIRKIVSKFATGENSSVVKPKTVTTKKTKKTRGKVTKIIRKVSVGIKNSAVKPDKNTMPGSIDNTLKKILNPVDKTMEVLNNTNPETKDRPLQITNKKSPSSPSTGTSKHTSCLRHKVPATQNQIKTNGKTKSTIIEAINTNVKNVSALKTKSAQVLRKTKVVVEKQNKTDSRKPTDRNVSEKKKPEADAEQQEHSYCSEPRTKKSKQQEKQASTASISSQLLGIEKERLEELRRRTEREEKEQDEHYHFLMSILPKLRAVKPERQFEVKIAIMKVLVEEN